MSRIHVSCTGSNTQQHQYERAKLNIAT